MIALWRDEPVLVPLLDDSDSFPINCIFPSGRQALSYSLQHAGLTRKDRIAIPEWSSHCVISAVGKIGTPVPMLEVVQYDLDVEAVLVYEQWGWPLASGVMDELGSYFKGKILIHDMVDSAHFSLSDECAVGEFKTFVKIFSLSKTLGLSAGGLAVAAGKYLEFNPESQAEKLIAALTNLSFGSDHSSELVSTILKERSEIVVSEIKNWISENDVFGAIEHELLSRQENLAQVLNSSFAESWPEWMKSSVEHGAGPGIVPLLRGCLQGFLKATP